MALFTDGPASTMEDLAAQDSQVLDVASVEGIDLTRKLELAQETMAIDLENALAAVPSSSPVQLANVVVTPALRLWHAYRTLEMVYRDAYYNQLNDRYAGKREQFGELGQWARERLMLAGVGIAPRPVSQAATPEVVATVGSLPDNTYYVTMSWVNSAGEEGASAVPAAITTTSSGLLVRPKAGSTDASLTWNVYAGTDPAAMVKQNDAPIAADGTWTQMDALNTNGSGPGQGQCPSYFHALPRVIQRG